MTDGAIGKHDILGATPAETKPRSRFGVVVACALGNAFGMSTIIFSTFPMFLMPVTASLGWSAAQFSFTLTIIAIVDFFAYPIGGLLMDRFGARPVILIGNVLLGLSVMALATIGPGLYYSYLVFALVGACAALPSTVLLSRVISSWFRERRATALAVASGLAFGIGAAITPLIAQGVIAEMGWRTAYLVLGALPIFIVNPVMLILLWQPVASVDEALVPGRNDQNLTLSAAMRTRQFWLLLLSATLAPGAVLAITSHVVVLLADNGVGIGAAAATISSAALATAIWQLVLGRLLDKTGDPRIAGVFLIIAAIGCFTIFTGTTTTQAVSGGIMLGVGAGTEYALLPYSVSFYFGLRDYGVIYGFLFGAASLVMGASAFAMDIAFMWTGKYDIPSWCCVGVLCFCAGCLFALPKFRQPKAHI